MPKLDEAAVSGRGISLKEPEVVRAPVVVLPADYAVPTLTWRKQSLRVVYDTGTTHWCEAEVLGPFAVHAHLNYSGCWRLLHVPSGNCLCNLMNRQDAVRVGSVLWQNWRKQFALKDVEGVTAALEAEGAGWVAEWVMSCHKHQKFQG